MLIWRSFWIFFHLFWSSELPKKIKNFTFNETRRIIENNPPIGRWQTNLKVSLSAGMSETFALLAKLCWVCYCGIWFIFRFFKFALYQIEDGKCVNRSARIISLPRINTTQSVVWSERILQINTHLIVRINIDFARLAFFAHVCPRVAGHPSPTTFGALELSKASSWALIRRFLQIGVQKKSQIESHCVWII